MAAQKRGKPPVDRAQTRRQLEVVRRREGILEAAGRAFARGGYHVTTMQDIAREAGYTPPSLYAYFESKEQIFLELAALLAREFSSAFEAAPPAGLPLRERLELLLHQLFELADRHRAAVSVFLVAGQSGDAVLSKGMTPRADGGTNFSSFRLFVSWLRKNARRSELGGNRPEDLGVALAGLTQAFCVQWLAEGSGTGIEAQVSRLVSLFLYGAMGAVKKPSSR